MAHTIVNRSHRRLQLTGVCQSGQSDAPVGNWGKAVEQVIQQTLVLLG